MRQRQRLRKVLVKLQHAGQGARDLRHFDGVGETVAEMVRQSGGKDLRLRLQPAEGARVHHAVAVALEPIAIGVLRFRVSPSPALSHWKSQPRQHARGGATAAGFPTAA